MIGVTSAAGARLVEVAEHSNDSGVPPWAVGLTGFVVLLLLLYAVTRFNRDR